MQVTLGSPSWGSLCCCSHSPCSTSHTFQKSNMYWGDFLPHSLPQCPDAITAHSLPFGLGHLPAPFARWKSNPCVMLSLGATLPFLQQRLLLITSVMCSAFASGPSPSLTLGGTFLIPIPSGSWCFHSPASPFLLPGAPDGSATNLLHPALPLPAQLSPKPVHISDQR